MYNGIIYKYTSPSGKVYIGQTMQENERRQTFLNPNKIYAGNFSTYCNGRNNHEYKGFLYYRGEKDNTNDQSYMPG